MDRLPDISIIGPGRVGTAIGVLAGRANLAVVAVAGGAPGRAEAAAAAIGGDAGACSPQEAAGAGGLVLLTVPDDAIAGVCQELSDAGAFSPGTVVAHCCGALGSDVLAPARDRCGCLLGSIHPLQTFPTTAAAVAHLPGSWCFCEGDSPAVEVLQALAGAIGAHAVRIDPAGKPLYHAAGVMACNYLVALLDAAAALAAAAGVDRTTWPAAVGAIVQATVDNVSQLGPQAALTGPIARGDVQTVARHVRALAGQPRTLRLLYAAAGHYTVGLALRNGSLGRQAAEEIRERLDELAQRE
jgi:predicted short-subunit dehydrogenase-like oxidoreductase (DUF2520 family)